MSGPEAFCFNMLLNWGLKAQAESWSLYFKSCVKVVFLYQIKNISYFQHLWETVCIVPEVIKTIYGLSIFHNKEMTSALAI